jgi:hypothetical protein
LEAETGRQIGHETVLVQWQTGKKTIVWPERIAQARLMLRPLPFPLLPGASPEKS